MRTTLSISDELLEAAKRAARAQGVPLGTLVDAALRRHLTTTADVDRVRVPVFRGGTGPRPGVDLTSSRAMAEALDADVELSDLR